MVYGNSVAKVDFDKSVRQGGKVENFICLAKESFPQAVINMEWRPEYTIHVESSTDDIAQGSLLRVKQSTPPRSASEYGIYNHFVATAEEGDTVRIVPRFVVKQSRF